jgi:hypothetical protein
MALANVGGSNEHPRKLRRGPLLATSYSTATANNFARANNPITTNQNALNAQCAMPSSQCDRTPHAPTALHCTALSTPDPRPQARGCGVRCALRGLKKTGAWLW